MMIIRFELPDKTAINAAMPAPIRDQERVLINGEQYGARDIFWQINEEEDSEGRYHGYGLDEREWDQYVVLVRYHVRSERGDRNSPLVPEKARVLL